MNIAKFFVASLGIGSGIGLALIAAPAISGDNVYDQVRKFNDVLNRISRNYVEDIDSKKLTEAAIKGMLNELDPHSSYIPAENMQKVQENFQGSFDGIGVEFQILKDTITVVAPIAGGPSEMLGILSGDKIVKVDGESVVGIAEDDVPKKLKGPRGTKVVVDIKRIGEKKPLVFEIIRDKIPIATVDAAYIVDESDIGLISINRFAANTHSEFVEAAENLRKEGMKRMILDLRGNPGGYLDQAIKLADEFLPGDKKIVYTKARRADDNEEFYSTDAGNFENIPLIILVNAASASASEIVSGAVQDLDRGLVVGETSFGKGLVQQQYVLPDGSAFRLTVSRYYTPSGRLIQRHYGSNKDDYYKLEGREEGEEGENFEHKAETSDKKDRPMYRTAAGRAVFGGGGITPDFIVKQDTITKLTRTLRSKNLFWEFSANYLQNGGKNLRSNFKDRSEAFIQSYSISPSMLQSFRSDAELKGVVWNDADYAKDSEYISTILKATIARSLFGSTAFYATAFRQDRQIQKAVTLFPEAAKIARIK